MKHRFTFLILTIIVIKISAQTDTTKYWKVNGTTSIIFSQVSLTNWSEGGDESLSGTFLFKMDANKLKNRLAWDNHVELEYGFLRQGTQKLRKSVDRILYTSKLGYQLRNPKWFATALMDFRTQFAKGYSYPNTDEYISKIMSPGYLNIGLGFDHKPNDHLSIYLSPLNGKFTFVLDDTLSEKGYFGVSPGNNVRSEFGGLVKCKYIRENIVENVTFETMLDLFSNYLDKPANIDVIWDVKIDMKVNKYLSANLFTSLKYDDDIDYIDKNGENKRPKVQFKELFGAGMSYNF